MQVSWKESSASEDWRVKKLEGVKAHAISSIAKGGMYHQIFPKFFFIVCWAIKWSNKFPSLPYEANYITIQFFLLWWVRRTLFKGSNPIQSWPKLQSIGPTRNYGWLEQFIWISLFFNWTILFCFIVLVCFGCNGSLIPMLLDQIGMLDNVPRVLDEGMWGSKVNTISICRVEEIYLIDFNLELWRVKGKKN